MIPSLYFMNGEFLSIDTINHIAELEQEIKRLNKGYCELKEKCNNGECDCTKEEYNSICEANIKLYLEVDKLNKIIEIKTNRIQDLMSRLSKRTERIDKAIEYITTEQLYTNYQWGKSQYVKILKDLLDILKGSDKE